MNKKQLDKIKKRVEAATEGPWEWEAHDISMVSLGTKNRVMFDRHVLSSERCEACQEEPVNDCMMPSIPDSDFIAHARQDIPDLLAYVEELEEIEQIYKRGNENYEKRIAKLLERVERMGKAIQSASYAKYLLSREDNA